MADTKKLYALAQQLGLVEKNNPDDPFHQIIFRITGKLHVSELNKKEEKMVLNELVGMQKKGYNPQKISESQQRKVWRLIYRLCEINPSEATPFERLSGAIKKILNTSSFANDPFRFVQKKDANKLINTLQGYVKSAEKKAKNSCQK